MSAHKLGLLPTSVFLCSAAFGSGCGLEDIAGEGAQLNVFAAHHATPENGKFAHRGDKEKPRVFDTDTGWHVTLLEGYVTTTGVVLLDCYGGAGELNMFWGPCAEDMRLQDLDTTTMAGRQLPPGDYCGIGIQYAGYNPPPKNDPNEVRHAQPTNAAVFGSSVYLRGAAEKSGFDQVQFELRVTQPRYVEKDISDLENGAPLNVSSDEAYPVEVTVSKTYDRFFDGVDFSNFNQKALEDRLLDIVAQETRISLGNQVEVY